MGPETEGTTAKIIPIAPYLKPSRKVVVDFLIYHDGEFAYQIHSDDTAENRTFHAAMFRVAADDLEEPA